MDHSRASALLADCLFILLPPKKVESGEALVLNIELPMSRGIAL